MVTTQKKELDPTTLPAEPVWQDGAGSFLLLAALHQTGLGASLTQTVRQCLSQAEPALAPFSHSRQATTGRLIRTLLFLPVAELARPWDLRSYSGQRLA